MSLTRRGFLTGCSSAIAAMSGARITGMAFADAESRKASAPNKETLVLIYLRGGMDILNTIVPIAGNDRAIYEQARQTLGVNTSNLTPLDAKAGSLTNADFGLNNNADSLIDLYQQGNMAVVMNTGSIADSRSHFDMQHWMEIGATGGGQPRSGGWLARHLNSCVGTSGDVLVQSISVGNAPPEMLDGSTGTLTISGAKPKISFASPDPFRQQRVAMRDMFETGNTIVHAAGRNALDASEVLWGLSDYGNYENATLYAALAAEAPLWTIQLQRVAEVIKSGLGLQSVTIDLGGWDTHSGQGDGNDTNSYYSTLLRALTLGIKVFMEDLAMTGHDSNVTVMAMTEFGRRLEEGSGTASNGGTDHGHGGGIILVGEQVNGGLYGEWTGLEPENLYEGIDLPVTTDYRAVVSEYMMRRQGNKSLGYVFPGYAGHSAVDVFAGTDVTPDYGTTSTCVSTDGSTTDPGDGTKPGVLNATVREMGMRKRNWQGVGLATAGLAATSGLIALRNRSQSSAS